VTGITSVLFEILRARLWLVPGVAAVLAAVAALVVLLVDPGSSAGDGPFAVSADSARAVLSAISGAMITFTALVFSITMLVLQQAAAQLSPRVMRTFLRDRFSQAALGLFVAAFVFALLVLLDVREGAVSRLGVLVAVGLVLGAALVFVAYIDHMAHAIRPISVIRSIGVETRDAIDRVYPADRPSDESHAPEPSSLDESDAGVLSWPADSGYIQAFDEERLLEIAEREGRDLWLLQGVGAYLVHGSPLLAVEGKAAGLQVAEEDISEVVRAGAERTMSQDPEFGFRQLVDIALRALSPSLNDPTTAVQVIDELHDLLRCLLDRPIPSPRALARENGRVVSVPAPSWDSFVHAAVDEIARAGREHATVARRLGSMLRDLERDCAADRRPALRRSLELIGEGATTR
jgi:uncharacterized membrane protein